MNRDSSALVIFDPERPGGPICGGWPVGSNPSRLFFRNGRWWRRDAFSATPLRAGHRR